MYLVERDTLSALTGNPLISRTWNNIKLVDKIPSFRLQNGSVLIGKLVVCKKKKEPENNKNKYSKIKLLVDVSYITEVAFIIIWIK